MRQRAVFWLWGMLTASLALAQDTKITVPLGWYSAEELAQALSSETRTVSVHPQLRQRVLLVHLRDRSFEEVRQLLRKGTGIRIEPTGARRWQLEWDPDVLRREQRWRQQVARELDKEIAQRMRNVLKLIPPLPAEHFAELMQVSKTFREMEYAYDEEDTERPLASAYRRKLQVNLDSLAIPFEVEKWARAIAELPDEIAPRLYLSDDELELKDKSDLRYRSVLSMASHTAFKYHAMLAVALMYQEPTLTVSALEAMENGMSVRAVSLARLIEVFPQIASLKSSSLELYGRIDDDEVEDEKRVFEDLWLIVRLTLQDGISITYDVVSDQESIERMPLSLPAMSHNEEESRERSSIVDRWLRLTGTEGRQYVEEARQATRTALQHPKLNAEFEVGKETLGVWSRWVYRWAEATDSEVVMLLCPPSDPIIRLEGNHKTTLARLYTERGNFESYWGYNLGDWGLRSHDDVLIVENLRNFVLRLYDYPLASLKRLMERYETLTYDDLREYYRSVTPEQNRWWMYGLRQWVFPPYRPIISEAVYPTESGVFAWAHLWYALAVLESLPEGKRNTILSEGAGVIQLEDIPPASRRSLTESVRMAQLYPVQGLVAFHPNYQVRAMWFEAYRPDARRGFMAVRIQRKRTGEGKEQLVLRTQADELHDPEYIFTFNSWRDSGD